MYIYADAPKNIDELKIILEDMKKGGPSIDRRPEYYKALKGHITYKYKFSKELDDLEKIAVHKSTINQFKSEYGDQVREFVYFRITGKATSRLLVIDRSTEQVVDYIDINPFAK